MNQARFSVIATAHKGIRNALSQLSLRAGNTDYTQREEVLDLRSQTAEVLELLEEHAAAENDIILAALESRVPGSGQADRDDHEEIHHLQDALLPMLDEILSLSASPEEAMRLGQVFYQDFSLLHAAHLNHMMEEERGTQVLMWEHFSDDEMRQFQGQVLKSMAPELLLKWQRYILPAQNPVERFRLISSMKASAPAPFVEKVLALAARVLPERAYQHLRNALEEYAV